jgi:hypothetical protein
VGIVSLKGDNRFVGVVEMHFILHHYQLARGDGGGHLFVLGSELGVLLIYRFYQL